MCLREWTEAGVGEYERGGERRQGKTEGLNPEHANPVLRREG